MAASPAVRVSKAVEDAGGLVGANRAAELLAIAPPNFRRYRPRLTEVPVEGSAAVFVKAEVEALAQTLTDEREARLRGAK